ncbi:MAG: hypothetical protein MJA83_17900 [Gammaproteobacteria bacterium]|nr:hypothetical protein [Gammaproteobacteria bacterium]
MKAEVEIRRILKEVGAEHLRVSSNSHDVWKLPGGKRFVCPRDYKSHGASPRAWRNILRCLKKIIKDNDIRPVEKDSSKRDIFKESASLTREGLINTPEVCPMDTQEQVKRNPILGAPWSEEDIEKLHAMYKDGVRPEVIAELLGRTVDAVRQKKTKLDKKKKSKRTKPITSGKSQDIRMTLSFPGGRTVSAPVSKEFAESILLELMMGDL